MTTGLPAAGAVVDDTGAQTAVERALQDAVARVGVETLLSGGRAEAVLRDLVGSSGESQPQRVRAVALMVMEAARTPRPMESDAVKALPADLAPYAPWAADLVSRVIGIRWEPQGARANLLGRHGRSGQSASRRIVTVLALLVALVVVGWLGARWLEPDTTDEASPSTTDPDRSSSTVSTVTTSTIASSGLATGLSASYPPLQEGPVIVERNITWWDDTGGALVSLRFSGPSDQPVSALHREATFGDAPPEGLDPPAALNGGVLTYDLALPPGQSSDASYFVPIDGAPTLERLQELVTEWAPRREAAIPAIDDRQPIPEPIYENCRVSDDGSTEWSCTPVE